MESEKINISQGCGRNSANRFNLVSIVQMPGLATVALCVYGCVGEPKVNGKVVNQAGIPLEGVTVSVAGTEFQATTDASGRYGISFVPGKFLIRFSKKNYTYTARLFEIASPSTVPADTVALMRLPEDRKNGVILYSGETEVNLAPAEVTIKTMENPKLEHLDGLDRMNAKFRLEIFSADFRRAPQVPSGNVMWLDVDKGSHKVLLRAEPSGVLLRHEVGFSQSSAEYRAVPFREIQQGGGNLCVPNDPLPTGLYAYIGAQGSVNPDGFGFSNALTGDLLHEPAFTFRVSEKELK